MLKTKMASLRKTVNTSKCNKTTKMCLSQNEPNEIFKILLICKDALNSNFFSFIVLGKTDL